MSIKVIILATPNPENTDALSEYAQGVGALIQAAGVGVSYGGRFVEGITGSNFPTNVTILEFESKDAVDAFVNDEKYQALIPARDKAFSQLSIFITENR